MNLHMLIAACHALTLIKELAPEALALKMKLELYARDPQASAYIGQALASNLVAQPAQLR